jgi:hypothetical protein
LQELVNFGLAAGTGLWLARRIGLGAPVLEGSVYGEPVRWRWTTAVVACVTGLIFGGLTVALLHSRLAAALTAMPAAPEGAMPLWKGLLACF